MSLTEGQSAALEALRASDQPMTTREVLESTAGMAGKNTGNTRRTLLRLVSLGLAVRVSTGEWAAVENGGGCECKENGNAFLAAGEAKAIIGEALAFYFDALIKTDPEKAARVAYAAGLNKVGLPRRQARKADEPRPEPQRKKLPKDLTVVDFCAKAEAAYRSGAFSLDDVSEATQLGRDYLRKIFRGEAAPRDETLEKIYAVVGEHLDG